MNELQTQQNTNISMTSLSGFELGQRVAKMLASSTLVPQAYKGNVADCMIALNMANRMGADPLMVLQNLVIVHGRPTWSSQFLIATFNSCGRYSSIKFQFFGDKNTDDYGCRATATELSTGEKLEGPEVTIALSKAEGWYSRNGSKWKTIPDLMLRYRAAAWFVRTVAPELSMGLHTQEEVIDISDFKDITPKKTKSIDDLIQDSTFETIYQETGEIIDQYTDQKTEIIDQYVDLRLAISECQSRVELIKLMNEMPKESKKDLHALLVQRQDQLNV